MKLYTDFIGVKVPKEFRTALAEARNIHYLKYENDLSKQIRAYIIKGLREDGVEINKLNAVKF